MTGDYEKIKKEFADLLQMHKNGDLWIKVHTATGSIYGKFHKAGENLVYLMPSLVYEERKEREGFNLEERIPTSIVFSSICGTQPVSKESIEYLLSKGNDKNKTGFGTDSK